MSSTEESIVKQLMTQLQTVGFLLLTNVSCFDEVELYYWTKWLFSLEQESKQSVTRKP